MKPQHILLIMICAMVFGLLTLFSEGEQDSAVATGLTPCDSLRDANLELELRLGRYEVALDILKDEDSAAAEKYQEIIETQTE